MRRARAAAFVAGFCALAATVGAATAALSGKSVSLPTVSHATPWSWYLTGPDKDTYAGRLRGVSDLGIGTNNLTDGSTWSAGTIHLEGDDGDFEFEHYWSTHKSVFSTGSSGGSIAVGASDGQDIVPLIVAGSTSQHSLQLWTSGKQVVASLGADGGLTIGGIELVAWVDATGRVHLDAITKTGERHSLLVGIPGSAQAPLTTP